MKFIIKLVFALLLCTFSTQLLTAQDVIHKANGDKLLSKIVEVGSFEIKYYKHEGTQDLLYAIDKREVTKVVFENGQIEYFESQLDNPDRYAHQKYQALKMDFLAPLRGHFEFSYEKMVKPGRGYELKLGIIGPGVNQYDESIKDRGAYLSASAKLTRKPDFSAVGTIRTHVLNGTYIRPEVVFGAYKRSNTSRDWNSNRETTKTENRVYGGFLLNVGKQWMFGDLLIVDVFYGAGYGIDNTDGFYDGVHYGMSSLGDGFGLIVSAGLSVGIQIGGKKKKKEVVVNY